MDTDLQDKESFMARIQQLEHERDELRKDIEQLCMQQAGPSYLVVATRMHFQRTAGLEQEIENLKKKLAACTRDNINLQEELSEAYRIKSQLADLHHAEVEKNTEAEKQVKFFQGCVAGAFAERDQSMMEAEKAKEKEELVSQKFGKIESRLDELTSECLAHKKLNDALRVDLVKLEEQSETLKKVVNKFYDIRQHSLEAPKDTSWDDKCACLLLDSSELWTYNDTSTSGYIHHFIIDEWKSIQSGLEEELEMVKNSMDNLQSKLRVGLEIENHLKKRVHELEKKQILSDKMIVREIERLRDCHSQYRDYIIKLLREENSHIELVINMVEERARQIDESRDQNWKPYREAVSSDENECRDVHISTDAVPELVSKRDDHVASSLMVDGEGKTSEALSQALQEKVSALLLLSQQEERHLLERNVNGALQKKIEELQRNLLQVTNEKVKALMELAHLKQEYHQLQERIGPEMKKRSPLANIMVRSPFNQETDGKLRNLLKKTYLRHWIGGMDFSGNEAGTHPNGEGNFSGKRSNSLDFARMKIENATFKESIESMEHLISSIHRLRLALLKAKESVMCEDNVIGVSEELDVIISEAKLVKTALGSSLPVSWSAEADDASVGDSVCNEPGDIYEVPGSEKKDFVSAAGFEMVELLILAAQMLKDDKTTLSSREGR